MKPVMLDEKGHIVLPRELHDRYGIAKGDLLWFVASESGIELQPAAPPVEGLGPVARAVLGEFETGKTRPLRAIMATRRPKAVRRQPKARPRTY